MKKVISVFMALVCAFSFTSCKEGSILSSNSLSLTKDMRQKSLSELDVKAADNEFTKSVADFSVSLFKKSLDGDNNMLISPLSVLLALSMTANGADNATLEQMENVLGSGISVEDLNKYLLSFTGSFESSDKSKIGIANSVWIRDREDIKVKPDFLEKCVDYYNAEIFRASFGDETVGDINNWISGKTDGLIKEMLDQIPVDAVLYLINAIIFDAEWERIYNENDIFDGEFTNIDNTKSNVSFMNSEEFLKYFETENAAGFIKPYAESDFSFAAILPNQDADIYDLINSLDGTAFIDMLSNATEQTLNASMPKFKYDYSVTMNDILKGMGMTDAFNVQADFTKMAETDNNSLYISRVLHKAYIAVDEKGTKAGAATIVEMTDECASINEKNIKLDRPFIYAIIDNNTNLPIFMGAVLNL